jgi:hypothetical protein
MGILIIGYFRWTRMPVVRTKYYSAEEQCNIWRAEGQSEANEKRKRKRRRRRRRKRNVQGVDCCRRGLKRPCL